MKRKLITGLSIFIFSVASLSMTVFAGDTPAAPANMNSECTASGIKLSWDAVNGAEQYNIYYRSSVENEWKRFASTSSTNYTDVHVANGVHYYYNVRSVGSGQESSLNGNGVAGVFLKEVRVTSISQSGGGIRFDWSASENADGYELFWRMKGSKSWKSFKRVSGVNSYTDYAVEIGKEYEYLVRAYKISDGRTFYSAYTDADSKGLSVIGEPKVSAAAVSDGIKLSWDAIPGATEYSIFYWSYAANGWKKFASTQGLTYTDKAVTAGVYYYCVQAVCGGRAGEYGNKEAVGAYLPASKVTSLKQVSDGIKITWSQVSGADGYSIYWRYKGAKDWKKFRDVEGALSYTDSIVDYGSVYEYVVRPYVTVYGQKYFGYYTEAYAKQIVYLEEPVLSASCASDGIKLEWKAAQGATGYKIYYRSNGNWKEFSSTTKTSYTDKHVNPGTVYAYAVQAVCDGGASPYGNKSASGTYLQYAKLTSIKTGSTGIALKWNSVTGADGYRLYWRYKGEKTWKGFKNLTASTTSYVDPGVYSGETYEYLARAYAEKDGIQYFGLYSDSYAKSAMWLEEPVPVINNTANGFRVSWDKAAGAESYNVYFWTGSAWSKKANTKECVYQLDNVTSGKNYYVTIESICGTASSGYGAHEAFGYYITYPKLKNAVSTGDGVEVSWQAVPDADGYYIYRKTPDAAGWKQVKTVYGTSGTDITVSTGTDYIFSVCAFKKVNGNVVKSTLDQNGIKVHYSDPVRDMARNIIDNHTDGTLRGAFMWSANFPYETYQPSGCTAKEYARYSFENWSGHCLGKAATFCWLARELGYEAYTIYGEVPYQAGGWGEHGWVEIVYNGTTYLCDPQFQQQTGSNGFMIYYGMPGSWVYRNYYRLD